ncbi:MAG: hypothetical protein AAFZ15_11885 [Bacteroidota bacterium]
MSNFTKIPHPLLSDSGTCQSERYPSLLNPEAIKIDDQRLEDVLHFINKYARFVNFYDVKTTGNGSSRNPYELSVHNWQELFRKSAPFQLTSLTKIDVDELSSNLTRIVQLASQFPEAENLQVLVEFIFSESILIFENSLNIVSKINTPFSVVLQRTMSSSLREPLESFIGLTKKLVALEAVRGINFNREITVKNWDIADISAIGESALNTTAELIEAFERTANIFLNELRSLGIKTAKYLPQILYPNAEDQQGKIVPHIGLLIAFFYLQKRFKNDLNDITRRHLLYFYNDVLNIKGKPARPDEAFIVFELQKQVENAYFLPKGTKVKDGKDDNKADIVFALEKDIVLDKAEIKELRTLYLNPTYGLLKASDPDKCSEGSLEKFTEGLYIAPKANSMDGVEEDFKEDPKNWATLGSKESKLLVGGQYQHHPPARVGFVLASPVLFLNEGHRVIDVKLCCSLPDDIDDDSLDKVKGYFRVDLAGLLAARAELDSTPFGNLLGRICPDPKTIPIQRLDRNCEPYIDEPNQTEIRSYFGLDPDQNDFEYSINDVIELLASEKIDEKTGDYLYAELNCRTQLTFIDFILIGFSNIDELKSLFYQQPFKICLSGKEGWLEVPNEDITFRLLTGGDPLKTCTSEVEINIIITLKKDFPAVTFSDAEVLGEELGTTHPSMKMELDPEYQLICESFHFKPCCSLLHCQEGKDIAISAYHFLRHLEIVESCIDVEVCGVKNLIVQNDESVQDVNGLVYPFGTRPRYERNDAAPYSAQGSNFYIGSQEVFCKNWKKFWININWKDKPASFCEHYVGYKDLTKNIGDIEGDDFQIKTALLEDGKWEEYTHNGSVPSNAATDNNVFLFNKDLVGPPTPLPPPPPPPPPPTPPADIRNFPADICEDINPIYQRNFDFERSVDFPGSQYRKKELQEKLSPYSTESRDAFVRMTLTKRDFQHSQYPFILARQMMAFGKLNPEGNSVYVPGAVYFHEGDLKNNTGAFNAIKDSVISIDEIINAVGQITDYLFLMGSDPYINTPPPPRLKICETTMPPVANSLFQQVNDLLAQIKAAIFGAEKLSDIDFENDRPGATPPITGMWQKIFEIIGSIPGITSTEIDDLVLKLDMEVIDKILEDTFTSKYAIDKKVIEDIELLINGAPSDPPGSPPIPDKGTLGSAYSDYLMKVATLKIQDLFEEIRLFLCERKELFLNAKLSGAVIPKEPWTPIIKEISLDYTAKAEETDIQLVHLHPFENTYSLEDITAEPSLLPVFTDEGTLFIALDNITKGNTLNLLFNMAEATANTEMSKPDIRWSYLSNNQWKDLAPGFAISNDGTNGLTKTGIVEIIMPADISRQGHTIMPSDIYWIKAAANEFSKAVCETITIHTQAAKVQAVLAPENDLRRLSAPLAADKINRLDVADTSIKKVSQPIPSFNGRPPESEATELLFRRISERLRHKGRAITGFDYERIVLENFPQVFKAKTISHALGLPGSRFVRDLEVAAPGHVLVAVIPDIQQLNSGNALEPRVPLSQLGEIKKLLQKKNSPFVQLKVLNPRYEKVNVAIKVNFTKGNTGPYFIERLEKDIEQFLAPWTKGKVDRLRFGAPLSKSDLISFVESLSYVDFICQIDWAHEFDHGEKCQEKPLSCCDPKEESGTLIAPLTARSILTAGKIKVCELENHCDSYDGQVLCKEEKALRPL